MFPLEKTERGPVKGTGHGFGKFRLQLLILSEKISYFFFKRRALSSISQIQRATARITVVVFSV
jgi:hypothetical protein